MEAHLTNVILTSALSFSVFLPLPPSPSPNLRTLSSLPPLSLTVSASASAGVCHCLRRRRRKSLFRIVHARGAMPYKVRPTRCHATPAMNFGMRRRGGRSLFRIVLARGRSITCGNWRGTHFLIVGGLYLRTIRCRVEPAQTNPRRREEDTCS